MIEFQVYGGIYVILLLATLRFIIPRSIKEHYTLVKKAKAGEPLPDVTSENGVSTRFINITDILSILLLLLFTGISIASFAESPSDTSSVEEVVTTMTLDGIVKSLVFQMLGAGVILCVMALRVNLVEQLGLRKGQIKKVLKYIALTLITAWGITAIIIEVGYFDFINDLLGTPPLQSAVIFLQESNDYLLIGLLAICACIGAPLVEELVFRAYLYPIVKHYTGVPFGIFFSALFFSLIHFNFAAMPTLFVMGVLLAYSYEKTKTLWTPVLAHFIFNGVTVSAQILSRFGDISLNQ